MTPDTKEACPVNGNMRSVEDYDRDIEECTKIITQKLDEVCAFAKEHGLTEELREEPHNNNDPFFIDFSEYAWKKVYAADVRKVRWKIDFARSWWEAYGGRAGAYMRRAGAFRAVYCWCRRCSVRRRREDWDYEVEINDYSRAIEDYMNIVRLQWGSRPGINSYGDAFAAAVRDYVGKSKGTRLSKLVSMAEKASKEHDFCVVLGGMCHVDKWNLDARAFLRRNYQTDIVITLQSAYLCKAEACFEAKYYESAVEEYTKLIRLSPEESYISAWIYPAAYIDRARALLCLGRNDEAVADFEEALRIDPGVKEVKASLLRDTVS